MSDLDNSAPATDTVAPITDATAPVAAETTADSAPATTDDSPADTSQPDKGKPEAGLQKAINRLTRQRGDAERRAMRAEARLEALAQVQQPQTPPAPRASELKESDYANYGDFVRAQAREAAREELAAHSREQSQRQAAEAVSTQRQTFEREAAEQAKAAGIDFEDAWETLLALPPSDVSETVAAYFYQAAENKAALAARFAQNTEEIARISNLPPAQAFRELAKVDLRLGTKPPPARTSSAPPPVPTVGGRAVTTRDPEKMDMAEYAATWKARKAQTH